MWSGGTEYSSSKRLSAEFVGDGNLDDNEWAHLNGVTSSVQTHLDGTNCRVNPTLHTQRRVSESMVWGRVYNCSLSEFAQMCN